LSYQLKNNRKIVERGKIDTLNTRIHGRLHCWLGTGTSIKSGRVKLALWAQTSPFYEGNNLMIVFFTF